MSNVAWLNGVNGDFGTAADWSGGVLPTSGSNVTISTTNIQTITFSGGDNFTVNSLTVASDYFDMTGGTLTVQTSASFAGEFELDDGTMTVTTGATFTDGYLQKGGTLQGTGTIVVSGSSALTGGEAAEITGGNAEGTLKFTNNGTMTLDNFTFGGATNFINNDTLEETGGITLGDNTLVNATINNKAGASFNIGGDYGITQGGSSASFTNSGTLEKIAGSNTSDIAVSVSSTGAIKVDSGTLEFNGTTSGFGGTITGTGLFEIEGGNATIVTGAAITVTYFTITDSSTVTLDENLTYGGTFSLGNGSGGYALLDLNATSLTLTGSNTFQFGGNIDGNGTLITNPDFSQPLL